MPTRIDGAAARGRQPDHVPRRAARRRAADRQAVDASARRRRFRSTTPQKPREYRLAGGMHARIALSGRCRDTRTTAAGGLSRSTSRIRCSSIARRSRRRYSPAARSRPASALHLDAAYQRYDWRARGALERGRISTICSGRRRRAARAIVVEASATRTRCCSTSRAVSSSTSTARSPEASTACPSTRTCRSTIDRLASTRGEAAPTPTSASRSATWTTRRGQRWSVVAAAASTSNGVTVPQIYRHLRLRHRPAAGPFLDLVAQRRRLLAERPRAAVRQLLLRRLRQQLDRPRRREALSRVVQLSGRRAERDRRAQLRQVRRSSGTLPPWRFRRVGIPGFYATWARPAVFVTALATNLDAAGGAARRHQRRRTDRFPVRRAVGAGSDAVDRRRGRDRAGTAAAAGSDGLAQGAPVAACRDQRRDRARAGRRVPRDALADGQLPAGPAGGRRSRRLRTASSRRPRCCGCTTG